MSLEVTPEEARYELNETLSSFRGQKLMQRKNMRRHTDSTMSAWETHSIYFYPVMYVGGGVRIVVFRLEEDSLESATFATYDDIKDLYTPMSADELISYVQKHPEPHSTLDELVVYLKGARRNITQRNS